MRRPDGFEVLAGALLLAAALVDSPELRAALWRGLAHTCQATALVIGRVGMQAQSRYLSLALDGA